MDNIFKLFPKSAMLNKTRCFYYNNFEKADFEIFFENGYFKVVFNEGLILKFCGNPFRDMLHPLRGYLKNYKPKEGDCVVDAGAYIGAFSIYVAKLLEDNVRIISLSLINLILINC